MQETGQLLVVGSSGFIGRAVVRLMAERGVPGVALSRTGAQEVQGGARCARVGSYEDRVAIAALAAGCEAAIMLAGRAHVLRERDSDPEAAFVRANRDVPVAVAEAFAAAGGRRFVFVSTAAVHGEAGPGRRLRVTDAPAPATAYGRSKWLGEQALASRCAELGLELVVIRPPLVYGAGAPGHFGRLLRAARRGLPLPVAAIRNRRDVIGVDNLADLLLLAAHHPGAAGRTFLVSDGTEVSTASIAAALYHAAGRGRRLVPVPPALLRLGARLLRRPALIARLLDDLTLDSAEVRATLGWTPPLTVEQGLERSVTEAGR